MEPSQSSNTTIMVLPDDILSVIIRCLPMRDAVKTSAVSKKWRYLWRSSLADIDFDQILMLERAFPDDPEKRLKKRLRPGTWFPSTVNRFLDLHTASKIHTFRICFQEGEENTKYIDRWVTFAIEKQAEKIIFDSHCSFPLSLLDDLGRVSSSLKHLHLSRCRLGPVNQACGLASLKTLSLGRVNFDTEQSLQILISGCPLLESLTIKGGIVSHNHLIIDNSFSRLKHLSVVDGFIPSLVISCSNLVSLEHYSGNLCLCDDHGLDSLQHPMIRGQDGSLCYHITTLLSQDLSRFASLKSVTIRGMLLTEVELADLFSACPSLERFCLGNCGVPPGVPFHHNLKFLDINTTTSQLMPAEVKIFCGPNLISLNWKLLMCKGATIKLVNCDGRAFSSSSPSPLRHLRITGSISHHSNFAAFKYLQELTLSPVGLGDDDILSLLSHCSCLERLSLFGAASQLRHFKIPFPSYPLKYLELTDHDFLQKIELCSTNLTTFVLHTDFMVPLYAEQAPRLTRVSIGSSRKNSRNETIRSIKELSVLVPQLETLTLFLRSSRSALDEDMLVGVPEFKHLKRMVVFVTEDSAESLLWVIPLIQIAPNLHSLELHLYFLRPEPMDNYVPSEIKCYHNHLKEVKISGFDGIKYDMEMAIYLLKYAPSLELMTIDPNPLICKGDGTLVKLNGRLARGIRFVHSWLTKHASSHTTLVIL